MFSLSLSLSLTRSLCLHTNVTLLGELVCVQAVHVRVHHCLPALYVSQTNHNYTLLVCLACCRGSPSHVLAGVIGYFLYDTLIGECGRCVGVAWALRWRCAKL